MTMTIPATINCQLCDGPSEWRVDPDSLFGEMACASGCMRGQVFPTTSLGRLQAADQWNVVHESLKLAFALGTLGDWVRAGSRRTIEIDAEYIGLADPIRSAAHATRWKPTSIAHGLCAMAEAVTQETSN